MVGSIQTTQSLFSHRSSTSERSMPNHLTPSFNLGPGVCYALFAYDIGLSIDLDQAMHGITTFKERGGIKPRRRVPHYFEIRPAPLRITQEAPPLQLGSSTSNPTVDVKVYDFGALSVTYRFPFTGEFESLLSLSEDLYENAQLLADSEHRVGELLDAIRDAVERPMVSSYVEDYVIFQLEKPIDTSSTALGPDHEQDLARILRCERALLSEQEIKDATSFRISFTPHDAALIDWHAALLFGEEMDDVRAVLEFVNVQLLEMRHLDHQLDRSLDHAYESLSKKLWKRFRLPGSFEADSTRIAHLQVESAILFERVTNALKLLGDQYLARVYRLASQRFHLESWDKGIIRKIQTLEGIYEKIADRAENRRMEVLEWIIIILIAISIVISFIPGLPSH